MLMEVMLICALTDVDPFYDCDTKWAIIAFDNYSLNEVEIIDGLCNIKQDKIVIGCASYSHPTFDAIYTPTIVLSGTNYYDEWGMNTLQHEIKHIKCRCVWEGHP